VIRILHLANVLETGGAEAMLVRLVSRTNRASFSNTVVSLSGDGMLGASIVEAGVPLVCLGMGPRMPGPGSLLRLARAIRRVRPHILQTWQYRADLIGLVVGKCTGVPAVCWNIRSAELDPVDHPASLFRVIRQLARLSRFPAAVIHNSQAGRRAHERLGYRPRRWEFIPNGFDTDAFVPSDDRRRAVRAELGIAADVPLVGLVARYHPMKDHATFVAAAAHAAALCPAARFLMAGRGVDRGNAELIARLASHGLSDRVRVLGDRSDPAALFAALDVAVSSSYSEAFPNVIGEAMSCGVPCVVTDVGESSRIVGETGIVVPPRNAEGLGQGIARVLQMSADERRALGRAARERIATEYSLPAVVSRYERVYESIADEVQAR